MSSIQRLTGLAGALLLAAGLTACGDKAQELAGQPKFDAAPYTGTGVKVFTESDLRRGLECVGPNPCSPCNTCKASSG